MAKIDDVAAAIVKRLGPVDTWKLQKLIYYCQAWHIVWERKPLFANKIEAWANGPVAPDLYKQHKGRFKVTSWTGGHPSQLHEAEESTIKAVLGYYGQYPGYVLAALTHRERPWLEARQGLDPGERGSSEIMPQAMLDYYEGLLR